MLYFVRGGKEEIIKKKRREAHKARIWNLTNKKTKPRKEIKRGRKKSMRRGKEERKSSEKRKLNKTTKQNEIKLDTQSREVGKS